MSKKTAIIGLLLAIIFFLVGFGVGCSFNRKQAPVPLPEQTIKVGVLADLSGDYASFLRGIVRGAEMASEDIGKETGRRIKLFIEDQKSCDVRETVTAMNKLTGIDEVDFIIGGSCSNTTLAAAPIAEKTKTVMISPSSSAPSVSKAGDYVFRTCPSDDLKAVWAAKVAYELGKRKMAIIVGITNEATMEAAEGTKKEFIALGGEVVAEERVEDKQRDMKTSLAKIKAASPDVLLISVTSPSQIGLLVKQAKEMDINIQIIHPLEAPENEEVVDIGGEAAEGLIYVMQGNPPETEEYQKLKAKYQEKYQEEDIPQYLTESYDALMLGVKAVLVSNGTRENIKEKLYEVSKTYQGVSGDVRFDENGDVNKAAVIKTIKNGQFVPYQR